MLHMVGPTIRVRAKLMEGEVTSVFFFFSSRRRHRRFKCDWSSDVCSSDLGRGAYGWQGAENPEGEPAEPCESLAAHDSANSARRLARSRFREPESSVRW